MKTLQMVFTTDFGKSYQFNIAHPKEQLTAADVRNVMQSIVTGNYFETTNGRPVAVKEAKLVERIETPLFKL
ncbi:DUF2922 domain-containing protein [Macrococcus equipercicus]|uniref:DUF2922 domain-containing protein n=1 Tax=Macrococcus equipercicus TaxID=69967 RepID=A0A9Q9BRJ2_9STAP|nr:DUF2922 domain-containing protein [Macrococcus equipercicus]KAA1040298.1 DUF2922 domain-containing protein [Macrococcus equipercicus]UTH12759.1 DUF2922 domain-containing protein [Macrococcus equipercicus]